jgi:ABC-2 type transport system ATP-binding protein
VNAAISAASLSKSFNKTRVLDDLNLDIPEASIFGLVGPNGAGKTTAIKILMNILKPTAGRCEVLGVDSRNLGPAELASIGYVSENQDLPGWMSVGYFMRYLKPFYPAWDDSLAAELLRNFELPRKRKIRHLSRGMWMKAALASSLAYRPRLLVMDEPFSGLDPLVREDLIQGLLENAAGITVLVSSHDLSDLESFASHIGYLDRGHLQFSEEMGSLTNRFREVEVTVDPSPAAPINSHWPAHWLRRETSPALVRFVETQFDAERTCSEIRRLFGGVRNISVNPMPLRAIFITLARSASKTA